jgi:Protein of unknown function (DUF1552)
MRDLRLWMSRRTFLGAAAAGATSLARPFFAHAATGVAPQRLLLIHRPCGSSSLGNGRWWPTGATGNTGNTGWKASPLLSSFTDGKLASLQDQMVVLKGLTNPRNMFWLGDAHGSGFLGMVTPPVKDTGPSSWPQSASATPSSRADPNGKTITPADQSVDQLFLAQIAALRGAPCPVPSVQLAASTESADQTNDNHALRCTSYAKGSGGGPPRPLWPQPSPAAAFKNYFASGVMSMSPTDLARVTAQNKSVLDFAMGGLTGLQGQLPKSQLPKIQTHLEAIRQLETNLAASAASGMTCTPPSFPGGPLTPATGMFSQPSPQGGYMNVGQLDVQTYPMWQQHKEIIKTMFLCDLTRVVSFSFAYGNSGIHFQNGVFNDPALAGKYKDPNGNAISDPNGHHDISHGVGPGAGDAQYIIDKYYCDRTAELLAELAATPDLGGGTLLDNTLVVFWSEVSDGNGHGAVDMPVVLFGGKFLKLKGGSFLQLGATANGQFSPGGKYAKGPAPYMSDLWVTTAQAWGYGALTAYGDPLWNTGPIAGLYG